jgi:hypothetical protein
LNWQTAIPARRKARQRLRLALPLVRACLPRSFWFSLVYHLNLWGDSESRSGEGSRRDSPCVTDALGALAYVGRRFSIRSLNDIPCGDFNWIGQYIDAHPEIEYRGFDIVAAIIKHDRAKAPHKTFDPLDIVVAVPPRADLIVCKDLLNHLRYYEVRAAIANMRASGSKLMLATNNFGHVNSELRLNGKRQLDLCAQPLVYPAPIWRRGYLGLWPLAEMTPNGPPPIHPN